MKRTTKRYVFSTSAVNCYGYRVLSNGGEFDQYKKNPILLWMHLRAYGSSKDQILPVGRAVDIELNGDEWSCYLEFDETDEFAMKLFNKYENGTLNMLSLGAKPLEWTEDVSMMLAGQTGPTITKWKVTDISCVDIGGNDDACACQLYDADDKKIELASLTPEARIQLFQSLQTTTKEDKMKTIALTGSPLSGILLGLKLGDDATEVQFVKSVTDVIELADKQAKQIETLTAGKTTAENKVTELQNKIDADVKLANEQKVTNLVEAAITDKKILPAQKDAYIKLANADFENTKSVLDAMVAAKSVAETVNDGKSASTALINLSYDELDRADKLVKLKAENFDLFKAKYQEKFGNEYTGAK